MAENYYALCREYSAYSFFKPGRPGEKVLLK